MPESLKKGIATKYLSPLLAAYAALATLLAKPDALDLQVILKQVGSAGLAGIVMLVVQEFLPRPAKETLIYWRLRDRLPGCRAFSRYAQQDTRIDQALLQRQLPKAEMSAAEQNALWYRWLLSSESDPAIADNHQRVLALRDSAVLLLLLTLVSPALILVPDQTPTGVGILSGICLAAYIVTMIAARNAGVRLVINVIARKLARGDRDPPAKAPKRKAGKPKPTT